MNIGFIKLENSSQPSYVVEPLASDSGFTTTTHQPSTKFMYAPHTDDEDSYSPHRSQKMNKKRHSSPKKKMTSPKIE